MRAIALLPAFLLVGSLAVADDSTTVDLDRPGTLRQLKQHDPQRYQAVNAALQTSAHAPCDGRRIALLKTRFDVQDLKCGMFVITTYPAKRHVSFAVEGTRYAATVVLTDVDTLQPTATSVPGSTTELRLP